MWCFGFIVLLILVMLFYLSYEMEKIPLFMTKAPEEIDPKTHPQLACLQALIHDEDRTPEGQWMDSCKG